MHKFVYTEPMTVRAHDAVLWAPRPDYHRLVLDDFRVLPFDGDICVRETVSTTTTFTFTEGDLVVSSSGRVGVLKFVVHDQAYVKDAGKETCFALPVKEVFPLMLRGHPTFTVDDLDRLLGVHGGKIVNSVLVPVDAPEDGEVIVWPKPKTFHSQDPEAEGVVHETTGVDDTDIHTPVAPSTVDEEVQDDVPLESTEAIETEDETEDEPFYPVVRLTMRKPHPGPKNRLHKRPRVEYVEVDTPDMCSVKGCILHRDHRNLCQICITDTNRTTATSNRVLHNSNIELTASAPGLLETASEYNAVIDRHVMESNEALLGYGGCFHLLFTLKQLHNAHFFLQPVDWKRLGLYDYPVIIKKPMDLGTVEKHLKHRTYKHPGEFVDEMRLVWINACTYNEQNSVVYQTALYFRCVFEHDLYKLCRPYSLPPAPISDALAALKAVFVEREDDVM